MEEKCFYDVSNLKKYDKCEYPNFFARFYDLIYSNIDIGIEKDMYLNKISSIKGKILEAGVGTGRLFAEALKRGADIYGVDISPAMIDVLRDKLDDKYHNRVIVKDVRDMNLGVKFDLIIAPFRVFAHFLEVEDQLRALNCIYEHLNTGGIFMFDVFVPDLNLLLNGMQQFVDFEGEYEPGKKIRRISTTENDLIKQITNYHARFEWEEEGEWKYGEWDVKLRYFFRYELENLISLSPFSLKGIYGDLEGKPLTKDSKNFIIECKKDF